MHWDHSVIASLSSPFPWKDLGSKSLREFEKRWCKGPRFKICAHGTSGAMSGSWPSSAIKSDVHFRYTVYEIIFLNKKWINKTVCVWCILPPPNNFYFSSSHSCCHHCCCHHPTALKMLLNFKAVSQFAMRSDIWHSASGSYALFPLLAASALHLHQLLFKLWKTMEETAIRQSHRGLWNRNLSILNCWTTLKPEWDVAVMENSSSHHLSS